MTIFEELLAQEAALKTKKNQLSFQIQEVDNSLANIRIRLAEIQNVNRNAITYNLPNEILSAIFEAGPRHSEGSTVSHTLPSLLRPLWAPNTKSPKPFELLVSFVSHRWRNVALHTPRLWTNIDINILLSTADLLDLYLFRSKTSLIDVKFKQAGWPNMHDVGFDGNVVAENFEQYLDRLLPHAARWRELILQNVFVGSLSMALSPLAHLHVPALKTLVIRCHYIGSQRITLFSAGAPVLSTLELYGTSVQPPLGAVTSLRLGNYFSLSYAEFSKFLSPMSALVDLSMCLGIVRNPMNQPVIELASVRSLDLHFMNGSLRFFPQSVDVLHVIDLPALELLTVRGHINDVVISFSQFHRTFPLVRSLKIVSEYFTMAKDMPALITPTFISLFPNVRDVTFCNVDHTPILHALHERQPTDPLLWPQLAALTITPVPFLKVAFKKQTWAYITKLVSNRLQLDHPISQIRLPSQIIERGTNRQQQRLREQVELIEC